MRLARPLLVVLPTAGLLAALASPAVAATSATTPDGATGMYANCTALHKTYPHGVGRANAHDKVSGSSKPVTTWKKDTKAYDKAMSNNKNLDRDKDGIACEQK